MMNIHRVTYLGPEGEVPVAVYINEAEYIGCGICEEVCQKLNSETQKQEEIKPGKSYRSLAGLVLE